jgi:hypothetical protein
MWCLIADVSEHCVGSIFIAYEDMKMEQTQCFETSAIKHHTPGNNPKDYTQPSEHNESLKSRLLTFVFLCNLMFYITSQSPVVISVFIVT